MNKNSALTDIEVSRLPSGNSICTDTKLSALRNSFFPLVQAWFEVLCWQRLIFYVGQEMVKEKYHSSKSGKFQGILTVPRHKVVRTSEFIFPLVQALVQVLCWQRRMFWLGQEIVREQYHFSKSWKSQGILTVPRHKDKSTFEFIFPLVQAWLKVPCWQRLVFCRILYRCSVLYRC